MQTTCPDVVFGLIDSVSLLEYHGDLSPTSNGSMSHLHKGFTWVSQGFARFRRGFAAVSHHWKRGFARFAKGFARFRRHGGEGYTRFRKVSQGFAAVNETL